MARHSASIVIGLLCALLCLSGCTKTSRVDANTTTQSLSEKKTAVALVRIGEAGTLCRHVAIMIGVREGDGYRATKTLIVANVRSITEAPVAEVELPPGEYHFLAYRCRNAGNQAVTVGDIADKPDMFRSSLAKFTLEPGEIVNIGYLHFNASRYGLSAFGRPVRSQIAITDWPLAELERFKAQRPQIYAQMKTRHMQIMADEGPDCTKLKTLKAEGKALPVRI